MHGIAIVESFFTAEKKSGDEYQREPQREKLMKTLRFLCVIFLGHSLCGKNFSRFRSVGREEVKDFT